MSNITKPGAVLFARDVTAIANFYGALCALSRTHAQADLVVLESEATQLVIHGVPPHIARKIKVSQPPTPRESVPVKLVFPVASIAAARALAPTLGGKIYPAAKEFQARGFRACDGYDPEGNVLQIREPAAHRPDAP